VTKQKCHRSLWKWHCIFNRKRRSVCSLLTN